MLVGLIFGGVPALSFGVQNSPGGCAAASAHLRAPLVTMLATQRGPFPPFCVRGPQMGSALQGRLCMVSGDEVEPGKFVRHSDLEPGCAPLGVVCSGFDEDQLEAIGEAIEDTWSGPDGPMPAVPIAVLGEGDLNRRTRLYDVLAQLSERDCVIPEKPARTQPLVMMSGFSSVQTSATVRAISALGLRGTYFPEVRPIFAVAVPRSLQKPLRELFLELEGDHAANAR